MSHDPSESPILCRVRRISGPRRLDAFRGRVAARCGAAMLESVARHTAYGRFSVYAWDSVETVSPGDAEDADPFALLAGACRPWRRLHSESELPFVGGWIGYLSYEAGRFIEPAAYPRRFGTPALPTAQWRLYDAVVVHDVAADEWYAAGVELPPSSRRTDRPALDDRLDAAERFVASCPIDDVSEDTKSTIVRDCAWTDDDSEYLARVDRVLGYIRAGDIFQANLSRTVRVRTSLRAEALYARLCRSNPSAYAAFLRVGAAGSPTDENNAAAERAILSSSPELFLRVEDRRVLTRPIKGTRPRGADADEDRRVAMSLAASEKDRAELNMIIDLERNDLGRVCEYGTVRVVEDGDIEVLPTVLHRTATISGMLRRDADAIDLLRAAFPGGSVTGAPKVRAMQIIDALEAAPRGPYCGAIGYISLNGDMQLNLPIRTMTVADGVVELKVGSGIVADSDPHDELRELDAKAAGMLAALDSMPDSMEHRRPGCAVSRASAASPPAEPGAEGAAMRASRRPTRPPSVVPSASGAVDE